MKLGETPGIRQATAEEIRAYARHEKGRAPERKEIVRLIVEDLDHILAE